MRGGGGEISGGGAPCPRPLTPVYRLQTDYQVTHLTQYPAHLGQSQVGRDQPPGANAGELKKRRLGKTYYIF